MTSYTQPNIMRYINRAILANLHHRPLKVGRLIVLKETLQCSHGNSLFNSPHLLYFNLLVIFSTKNIKWCHKLELTNSYACWIIHEAPLENMKMERQMCPEKP